MPNVDGAVNAFLLAMQLAGKTSVTVAEIAEVLNFSQAQVLGASIAGVGTVNPTKTYEHAGITLITSQVIDILPGPTTAA